jgi:DNA-binding NarL/FixJ family response regulator
VRLYREALGQALSGHPELESVETAAALDAPARLSTSRANIVLADPTTLRATDLAARAAEAGASVIAFAVAEEDETEVLACAEAGVAGFVARDATMEELIASLKAATQGYIRCSPRVAATVIRRLAHLAASRPADRTQLTLTRRESEIAAAIEPGLSNKEIASLLGIETATVKNHVHNILEKLHVRRRGEAAAVVRASRCITAPPIARGRESSM